MKPESIVGITALAVLTAAACSSTTLRAASQYSKTGVIGPAGGILTVTASDDPAIQGTSINVPQGALSSPVTIKIGATNKTIVASGALGNAIDFEPSGTVFAKPVTMTIPVALNGVSPSKVAVMAVEANGQSQLIAPTNVTSTLATFQASGFTLFGCLESDLDGGPADGGCAPSCGADAGCGSSDGCGGSCNANCCTPSCGADAGCGSSDGCGGTCDENCEDAGVDGGIDGGTDGGACVPDCNDSSACGSSDGCGGTCNAACDAGCLPETDTFVVGPPRADILFIVDVVGDGGGPATVASAISTFLGAATNIDYRIAVTTDNDDASDSAAEMGQLIPCTGCSVPGPTPTIISPSSIPVGGTTADPATALTDLLNLIPESNAPTTNGKHFFWSLYNALQVGPKPGVDFWREGVFFGVITNNTDDVDDTSVLASGNHDPAWYAQWYSTYSASLVRETLDQPFANPFLFTWNYISPATTITGTGFTSLGDETPATGYMLSAFNGFAVNSNDPQWASALTSVWTSAITSHTYYSLSATPSEGQSSMVVTVDGVAVPEFAGPNNPNWTYQSTLNAIVFNPNTDPPKVGSTISVSYPRVCGVTGPGGCYVCSHGSCLSSCFASNDPWCCGTACIDEQTDSANCGSCGFACSAPTSACVQGLCVAPGGG